MKDKVTFSKEIANRRVNFDIMSDPGYVKTENLWYSLLEDLSISHFLLGQELLQCLLQDIPINSKDGLMVIRLQFCSAKVRKSTRFRV